MLYGTGLHKTSSHGTFWHQKEHLQTFPFKNQKSKFLCQNALRDRVSKPRPMTHFYTKITFANFSKTPNIKILMPKCSMGRDYKPRPMAHFDIKRNTCKLFLLNTKYQNFGAKTLYGTRLPKPRPMAHFGAKRNTPRPISFWHQMPKPSPS